MQKETIAENNLARFERWILKPLQEDVLNQQRSHVIIFILISVAIDELASMRYRGEIPDRERGCVGKRYRKFIENYMPSKYRQHSALLYKGFRCKLVHEFQFEGIDIQQAPETEKKHLTTVQGDNLCLNSREFLVDLMSAFNKLKLDLTGTTAKADVVESFEKSGYKRWIPLSKNC